MAAMDAALHRGTVTPDEIEEVLVRCWNWPSIRRAQRALGLADGRAESPLESVSRLVIGWLRLPAPELQAVVLDRDGRAAGRLDFYWDEWGVAGEADGRGKYTNVGVIVAEKDRQEHLENHGLVFARWGCTDATRHPRSVKQRILNAYERGRARDRSGLPREWSVQLTKAATRREDVITNPVARQLGGKT
ncbi:hypothetical protein [uncultured Jatrophihabitans sp.]|uniref:hypothetical protein n=1 Tax=uncultured Jatrophihabitans sp. TaxID=1610747 RepID=UPI0035CA72CC